MLKKIAYAVLALVALGPGILVYLLERANTEIADMDAEARENAPGQFVELPDGVTHYDIGGPENGQVVVLVNGFSVPYYIWDPTFAALSEAGFSVLRYDKFGRGYSDRPDTTYDGALFERQIADLLDTLAVGSPVDLIGLSMGGAVVARFAANNPGYVRRIVFVDPTNDSWGEPPIPRPIGDIVMALRLMPRIAEGQMTDFLYPGNYPDWVDRYRVQMQYRGFRNAIISTIYDFGPEDHRENFARIQGTGIPVMLIWGLQDQTLPVAGAEHVQAVLDVEYFPVDDSGHLPHIEQAELVNPAIVEFLSTDISSP